MGEQAEEYCGGVKRSGCFVVGLRSFSSTAQCNALVRVGVES